MELIKHGHACVAVTTAEAHLVLDPGMFTAPGVAAGATAILITHEHPDHWTPEQLAASTAPILTIAAVAEQIHAADPSLTRRVEVVQPGDRLEVGLGVTVIGQKHAVIHPELPHFDNSGYLLSKDGRSVFHPGDALTMPDQVPDVLLLPVSAPWLKVAECIDYARTVGAPSNVAIHDAVYSEAGLGIVGGHLERFLAPKGAQYRRLLAGESVVVGQ